MSELTAQSTAPAIQAASAFPRTITLPSGFVAVQSRPLKGRDAVAAHRITGAGKEKNDSSSIEQGCALVSQVVTLNGKPVVMEDLLDLDLEDLGYLVEAVSGKSR